MASSLNVLFLSLVILAAVQGCCGENQNLLYNRDTAMVTAMKKVGQALQCFGDTTQDGLHSIQESLNHNTDMVIILQQEILDLKNKDVNNDQKVDELSQENSNLKRQLHSKNQNVATLTEEIMALKTQLNNKNEMMSTCDAEIARLLNQLQMKEQSVQNLQSILGDYERREQDLEKKLKELNSTIVTRKPVGWACKCEQQPRLEEIKQVVKEYRDYDTLERDLGDVLDHSSVEYKQLQQAESLWRIAYSNYTHLVALLLCAGLPVDTLDNTGDNMLHGAASGGHLQLVKLLVERGAGVNVRGSNDSTAFLLAAMNGHLEMVQYLVRAGADTTAKNTWGHNALHYARRGGYIAVTNYLEQLPQ